MDRLESLRFFIRLVEKKGIASAGQDFGMSPATATNRLAELEAYYEAKLINRTTRSISLTEEGWVLFNKSRSLVEESDDLRNQIRLGTQDISGSIRISAPQDLGQNFIAPLLDEFLKIYPDIRIELLLADSHLDLVGSGIDLSVRLGHLKDSSLKSRKLAENRRIVCASPDYLKKFGTPLHPTDLVNHNCLIMHWGRIIDREWNFQVDGRNHAIAITGNRASNNGAQVKDWCLHGHGIAFKSIWDVKQHLASGELVELLGEYSSQKPTALQILYPGGYRPSRRVRVLIDFLVECFENRTKFEQGFT